jgi:hypothetical protein
MAKSVTLISTRQAASGGATGPERMPQRDRLQTSGAATRGPMPRRTVKDGDRRWYLENFPAPPPAAHSCGNERFPLRAYLCVNWNTHSRSPDPARDRRKAFSIV